MVKPEDELLTEVAGYYSAKLEEHGATPQGVDWNGEAGQQIRFEQLRGIITNSEDFSLNDLGCGYGAFYDHLRARYQCFSYTGCDVSESMIMAAQLRIGQLAGVRWTVASEPPCRADYSVASGVFNVRLKQSDAIWRAYIEKVLDALDRSSLRGFAFNCLTTYSDLDKRRDYLYYADPCEIFDHCKRRYSKNVALLHDYGLYEFTVLVRKEV